LETIERLATTDYVDSVQQRGVWFDIYALYRDGLGWFVKIGEDDDGLLVISHHEPERGSLATVAGIEIKPVEMNNEPQQGAL
jgi:hypothetical protein